MKYLKLIIGFVFAGLFFWLAFQRTSFQQLSDVYSAGDKKQILAAVIVFLLGYAARTRRWQVMLQRENSQLTFWACVGPLFASFAGNNVLPFRAGDLIRTFAFNKRLHVSAGTVVASMVLERLLDLLMIVAILGSVLLWLELDIRHLLPVSGVAVSAVAGGILLVIKFPRIFRGITLKFSKRVGSILPGLGKTLDNVSAQAFDTLEAMSKGCTMLKLIFWSFWAWLLEGSVYWLVAQSLPSLEVPLAAWLALPVGNLATLIPSTPGYVGTFDYFILQSMTFMGNAQGAAAAYALLVHALVWMPTTILGGLYWGFSGIKEGKPECQA